VRESDVVMRNSFGKARDLIPTLSHLHLDLFLPRTDQHVSPARDTAEEITTLMH
jgi:hypothetical protein